MRNDEQIIEAYKQIIKAQSETIDSLTKVIDELTKGKTTITTKPYYFTSANQMYSEKGKSNE